LFLEENDYLTTKEQKRVRFNFHLLQRETES
jgi:hypothetical protein